MVKEIGLDLFKADKLAKDINYRRLLNIMILYTLIFILLVCIVLTLIYKFRHSWLYQNVLMYFVHKYHEIVGT